ncbi:hypothetical protein U472_02100 [Orenia metallireducens]|uniref:Uncharacterized protein n=1 Tax=Orenia metallireducens TaxID=1413210 RepID=A0A1C0ACC7_9FIRM|nr:DUF4363 family protein [Orenia metallireducens]OCL28014.1 hypothetical protein U472_02100 [Orenia metallireducens]
MRNKLIDVILLSFIIISLLGYFILSNQVFEDDSLRDKFQLVEGYIISEDWDKAKELSINIKFSWDKQKPWIMLNFAEAEFSNFEITLNQIIGGVIAKDTATALSNTLVAKDMWENFKRVVPEP